MKFFLTKDGRLKYLGFDDRWAMLLGILLVAGLASIILMGSVEDPSQKTVFICYLVAVGYTVPLWVINRFVIINVRHFFPRNDQTTMRIWFMIFSGIVTVILIKGGADLIEQVILGKNPSPVDPPLLLSIVVSFTMCIMVCAVYEFAYFFTKYRQSLLERERLAKANMQAQLTTLKQQVNPHFLFNSLNTLVNVIPEDQQLATRFTQRLAAVYRRLLEYRHQELISLGEELVALQDYVFLLKTRFENKLEVKVESVPDEGLPQVPSGKFYSQDSSDSYLLQPRAEVMEVAIAPSFDEQLPNHLALRKIVPLSLQLLVENAIKHNIISQARPLKIHILVEEGQITVKNNLQLRPKPVSSTGLGQKNIQQRYRLITGKSVTIEKSDQEYRVTLPLLSPHTPIRYATA